MHILHISSATSWRGGEQQVAYLLKGLSANSIRSTLMVPRGSQLANYAKTAGLRVITYRKIAGVNPITSWRITKICKGLKVDLIHVHDSHAHTYVHHAYQYMGLNIPGVASRRVTFAVKTLTKYQHSMIKQILCVSDAVAKGLGDQGIDKQKLTVVHSGIETERRVDAINVHQELGIESNTIVLTCVAALAPHKGHDTLLKGFAQACRETGQPLHLLLVGGDGGQRRAIEQSINQLHIAQHVSMIGYRKDPWSWLAGSDIALFASESEGLGTSVLDAMTIGTAVISTTVGGLATTVIDRQTALAIPPRDPSALASAILHLIDNPTLSKTLVDNARRHAQSFSVEQMVNNTVTAYQDVLANLR